MQLRGALMFSLGNKQSVTFNTFYPCNPRNGTPYTPPAHHSCAGERCLDRITSNVYAKYKNRAKTTFHIYWDFNSNSAKISKGLKLPV